MQPVFRSAGVALIAAIPFAGACVADDESPAAPTVRIVDENSEPVVGAMVVGRYAFSDPFESLGTSSDDGTFRIAPKADAASVKVLVRAEGYGLADQYYRLGEEHEEEDLTIVLRRAAPISGRLVDQFGEPAVGVRVRPYTVQKFERGRTLAESADQVEWVTELERRGWSIVQADPSTEQLLPWVETDEQGRFTIDSVAPDQLAGLFAIGERTAATTILVRTDDGPEFTVRTRWRGEEEVPVHPRSDFTHTVEPSVPIVGTITQSDEGKPVPLATVGPWRPPGFSFINAYRLMQVQTDLFGKYRLVGVGIGSTRVYAVPPDGLPLVAVQRDARLQPVALEQKLDMQMPTGVRVTGTVTDLDSGEPVPGTVKSYVFSGNPHLKALKPSSLSMDRHSAAVGEDGRYEIVVLPGAGILTFMARSELSQNYRRGIGWDEIDHDVYREEGNHTMYRTAPTILNAFNSTQLFEVDVPTIPAGTFEFDMVIGEERTDVPLRFTREGGRVPSQIYYSNSTPDASFSLWVFGSSEERYQTANISFFPGDKSRVTQAYNRDYELAGWTFVRPDDEEAVIELKEAATVRGRVLREDGTPLVEARLGQLYPYDPTQKQARLPSQPEGGYYPRTDRDGRFEFVGLAPGLPLTILVTQEDESGTRILARHYLFEDLKLKPGETRDLGDLQIDKLRKWKSE